MAKFPTYEEMSKKVAEKALDEFLYNGRSIREWMQIIASEDCISRTDAINTIENEQRKIMRSDWAIDQAKFSAMSEVRALIAELPSVEMKEVKEDG